MASPRAGLTLGVLVTAGCGVQPRAAPVREHVQVIQELAPSPPGHTSPLAYFPGAPAVGTAAARRELEPLSEPLSVAAGHVCASLVSLRGCHVPGPHGSVRSACGPCPLACYHTASSRRSS